MTLSNAAKKTVVVLVLGFLIINFSSICFTYVNKKSKSFTTDEVVYYFLGTRLKKHFPQYNTIEYAQYLKKQGRGDHLPEYFYKPLFKYPPLFASLIAPTLPFESKLKFVFNLIPILFGALLIPLTYLLTTHIAGRITGLLAALYIAIDPVVVGCSEKLWPETTLAFFTVLSVYIYLLGIKKGDGRLYILGGFFCGLSCWTKYPGILACVVVLSWAVLFNRDLLKNKHFIFSLFLPVLMLIPWFAWNSYFHMNPLDAPLHLDPELTKKYITLAKYGAFAVLLLGAYMLYRRSQKTALPNHKPPGSVPAALSLTLRGLGLIMVGTLIFPSLMHSITLDHVPNSSWNPGLFLNASPLFYIGRLIEFSPFYILAFIAMFMTRFDSSDTKYLWLSALGILLFFSAYGNYQSRYILACLPFLVALGSKFLVDVFIKASNFSNFIPCLGACIGLLVLVIFIVSKTMLVNYHLSYPNFFCYF